jgi:phospholipase/carboxylesterase
MKRSIDRGSHLDYLTVYPNGYVEGNSYPLVILLHGFGANKDDLSDLAPLIDRENYIYVLPDAPLSAADEPMIRAWYERGGKESPAAVREAIASLDGFVKEVTARFQVRPGRALLAGFSQGGAMSLRYGLCRPDLFAGVAVLSGSLRQVDDLTPTLPTERTQPIFLAHGRHDTMVPFEWSKDLMAYLEAQGYRPTYKTYPIEHEVSPSLIGDLRTWIKSVLCGGPKR